MPDTGAGTPEEGGGKRTGAPGPMVAVRDLVRTYGSGPAAVRALRGATFEVPRGELVAVRGRSGAGKTTLLNLIGGLDRPDAGRVVVDGVDLAGLGERRTAALRRDRIGFVFQTFGLVPVLTAAENVGVPLRMRRVPWREREERVDLLLSLVGLREHAAQRPGELSGGQQQRVAIARALANRPALLIADEPTAQLDAQTGEAVMDLLRAVVDDEGVTVLMTTHDGGLLARADRVLELRDGVVAEAADPEAGGA
ncbi:ABC transporter ATP-binding protein [Streptomyces glaucosporus]